MMLFFFIGSASLALAGYQKFFFSDNGTCPGFAWSCVQDGVLAACAYDSLTDRHYCCGGAVQASCRISSSDCLGADGGPSSTQQQCTAGESSWCCLRDTEECTPRIGQINVCIGTQKNTISGVTQELLNETFSSLTSATPAGTTYVFDATSLSASALSASTSGQSSTRSVRTLSGVGGTAWTGTPISTRSSSSSVTPSTSSGQAVSEVGASVVPSTASPTAFSNDEDALSSGKIAGIVVGCVAGLAAIIGAAYIVFRRRRRSKGSKDMSSVSAHLKKKEEADNRMCNVSELPENAVFVEMGGSHEAHELPNEEKPSELSTR